MQYPRSPVHGPRRSQMTYAGRTFVPLVMVVPLALALLAGRPARADGFRCGSGRLISEGDHMLEVRKKCGEPDFVSQRVDKRKVKVKVKHWVVDHEVEESEEQ